MPASKEKTRRLDLSLAVLAAVVPYGYELTNSDIARGCGVNREAIRKIEKKALRKLRTKGAEVLRN